MASFLWLTNWSEHNNRNKNGHQEEEWEKGSVGVRMLLSIFRSSNNDPLLPIIVGVQQKRAHIQSFHIFHIPHTIQLHIPTYRHTNITYRQNRRKATERRIRNKMEIFFGYYKICCFIMKINKYIVIWEENGWLIMLGMWYWQKPPWKNSRTEHKKLGSGHCLHLAGVLLFLALTPSSKHSTMQYINEYSRKKTSVRWDDDDNKMDLSVQICFC